MPCLYPFVPPPMEMLQKWILQHLHFFRRVVSSKTTCCFFKNDVLFLRKWRVTFSKWQVVFYGCLGGEKQHRRKRKRIPRILFVKIPIITLPRAHAYAHITGIFCFLLSQVSHYKDITLYFNEIRLYSKHSSIKKYKNINSPRKISSFHPH